MHASQDERDVQRADRWLTRSGGFSHLSPAAFELLQRRLRVRRRALWICSPLAVLALGVIFSNFGLIGEDEPGLRLTSRYLLAVGLLMAGFMLAMELNRRADNRIGATLDHRVIRAEPAPLYRIFGRVRSVCLIVILTVQVALSFTLACLSPEWTAGNLAVVFGLVGLFVGLGIWRVVTRSTLAVDEVSLAIDERLRSEDAYVFTQVLYLLPFAVPVSQLPKALPYWFLQVWIAGFVVIQLLWLVGLVRPPWKPFRPMTSDCA
jgi:hypothetical protein